MADTKMARPTGITILSILAGIAALFLILGGLALMAVGGLAAGGLGGVGGTALGVLGGALGIVLLILGVLYAIATWGLWTGKGWAWTLVLVLTVIGVILNLASFNVIGLVIDAVILWYLWQPQVKAFYGKAAPAPIAPTSP